MNTKSGLWVVSLVVIGCVVVYWAGKDEARRDPRGDASVVVQRTAVDSADAFESPDVDWATPAASHEAAAGRPDEGSAAAIIRHDCPMPVHPDTWHSLDEHCVAAMARVDDGESSAKLYRLIQDANAIRQAVVAALDDPECRLPPMEPRDADIPWNRWPRWRGEPRPDLHERCAAEAMVRLAELQVECVATNAADHARDHWLAKAHWEQAAAEASLSQDEYYRLLSSEDLDNASVFWKAFMCRSADDALVWVEALPEPLGDPADWRYHRPPYSQALDLYDTARRLGADVPEWADPSAFDEHNFKSPDREELPEGVYATEPFSLPPVRF